MNTEIQLKIWISLSIVLHYYFILIYFLQRFFENQIVDKKIWYAVGSSLTTTFKFQRVYLQRFHVGSLFADHVNKIVCEIIFPVWE